MGQHLLNGFPVRASEDLHHRWHTRVLGTGDDWCLWPQPGPAQYLTWIRLSGHRSHRFDFAQRMGAAGTDLPQKLDGLNVNNWTRGFTWAMAKYIYPLVNCHITMENHHFWWVNPLFQWPFSSLQTVSHYQRVNINIRLTCHRWNGSETAALHPATQPPGRGLVGLGHFHLRVVGRWQHRFGLDKMDLVRTMLRFGTCWNMFFNIVPPMLTQKPQKSQNKPHLVGIVGETWQVRHPLRVRTPCRPSGLSGGRASWIRTMKFH